MTFKSLNLMVTLNSYLMENNIEPQNLAHLFRRCTPELAVLTHKRT